MGRIKLIDSYGARGKPKELAGWEEENIKTSNGARGKPEDLAGWEEENPRTSWGAMEPEDLA